MNKENNCQCVVCNVEEALLDSFSTQTARNHFKALASNYQVLNHFSSPIDLIAQLHEQGEPSNYDSGNQVLHALIYAVSDKNFEELGQQLVLVAFTPAIHKIYREICQRFPTLLADDVAQQAWVAFLETAKSPALLRQNGQLPVALVMNCRKAMLRWAMREARLSSIVQDSSAEFSEPLADGNLEQLILLEDFLRQARRAGILSPAQHKLLLKFKYEGFVWKELGDGEREGGPSAIALYYRVQRAVNRLRRSQAVDFRSFRTMHSSLMLRGGARPEVVRDNMGHANIDVTQNVYGKSWWDERVDAVTRAVEAVTTAAQNAEKEAKKDQPESVSNEWVPLWVPQQEAKIASC